MAVGLNWSFKKGTCFSILNFYFIGLRFEFKFVGGGPTRQSLFVIRFAHPTGRLAGAQQKTLCLCKEK